MRAIYVFLILVGCTISHVDTGKSFLYRDQDSALLDMTPYLWNHGCANASVATILDYYSLVDGEYDVVSEEHVALYVNPIDRDTLIEDRSALSSPPKNCIADYLKTSWYSEGCTYASTCWWNIEPGIRDYIHSKSQWYRLDCGNVFDFDSYINYINKGIPVLVSVIYYDGAHLVAGAGYNRVNKTFYCYDTWSYEVREVPWTLNVPKKENWIIYGLMAIDINF